MGYSTAQNASATTINFDNVGDSTVVNNQYASVGVAFSNPLGGNVYARSGLTFAPSAPNVVSITAPSDSVFPFFDAKTGGVTATFSTLQSSVSIDARPVSPLEFLGSLVERPFLEGFDSSNNFLGEVL